MDHEIPVEGSIEKSERKESLEAIKEIKERKLVEIVKVDQDSLEISRNAKGDLAIKCKIYGDMGNTKFIDAVIKKFREVEEKLGLKKEEAF